jgi:hypothetical protein
MGKGTTPMIIDRAGYQFMWPGEAPGLGKILELNDHRAVIVGISECLQRRWHAKHIT